ncbi:adenine DNA glycosylase-like [Rutidosis leptorrhynchoides]|uniref:adenine DNA glycosylase-like n=1 Tax=Rutidosis leptorrhynchoides TaxID=125765 RepID=UPI003A99F8EA
MEKISKPKMNKRKSVPTLDIEDMFSTQETHKLQVRCCVGILPWRKPSEEATNEEDREKRAYEVWVSEVMLQQTRVQTVINYFNRWMQKWPTLHHLALASLEEVNEMWAGLGYYRRARFLLEGAKMIAEGGSEFPDTTSALLKVRGIGNYTARAIASIAFNEAVPVVDGNVIRVLARLKAISANPKDSVSIKNFWSLAAQLVDPVRPGDFNQSLMELGATICTPLSPSCSSCPVSDQCRAHSIAKNDNSVSVTIYPTKVVKAKQREEFSAVCFLEILGGKGISAGKVADSMFLLVKRPDDGLLAGLWEFPSVMLDGETDSTVRRKAIDQFLKKTFKLDPRKTHKISLREDVGEFVHIFSHIRLKIYVEILTLHLKDGSNGLFGKCDDKTLSWKCVDGETLSNTGLTSGVKKVYTMVQKFKQSRLAVDSLPARKRRKKEL